MLHKKFIAKCVGLYLVCSLFVDDSKEYVFLSVREQVQKVSVINLKKIVFADFGEEEEVAIEDI